MKCYRGKNVGVFAGPNGYYIATMADDGVSHYQPAGGGNGWGDDLLGQLNAEAARIEREEGIGYSGNSEV